MSLLEAIHRRWAATGGTGRVCPPPRFDRPERGPAAAAGRDQPGERPAAGRLQRRLDGRAVGVRIQVFHGGHDAAAAMVEQINAALDRADFDLAGGDRVIDMRANQRPSSNKRTASGGWSSISPAPSTGDRHRKIPVDNKWRIADDVQSGDQELRWAGTGTRGWWTTAGWTMHDSSFGGWATARPRRYGTSRAKRFRRGRRSARPDGARQTVAGRGPVTTLLGVKGLLVINDARVSGKLVPAGSAAPSGRLPSAPTATRS